jgi:hypothetical protein
MPGEFSVNNTLNGFIANHLFLCGSSFAPGLSYWLTRSLVQWFQKA